MCNKQEVQGLTRDCRRCNKQGVGETSCPKDHLRSYYETARCGQIPAGSEECAIHKHFAEPGHYIGDLQISLVEKVPAGKYRYSFLFMTAIRKRLEARWIKRLKASLNHNCQVWHLFSGYDASRGPPTRHDSI